MSPCAVARPARLAACASPRLRRIVMASSMLPLASLRAALHSIMPVPVLSRSCLTWSAVIAVAAISNSLSSARLRLYTRSAGRHGVPDLRREEPNRAQRVVVARDDEIHFIGIAVGVDDADDGNLQLARFVDRDLF